MVGCWILAVPSAAVASPPALQKMRGRDNPFRGLRRLIEILREINRIGDFLQVRFEFEIGRSREHRVTAVITSVFTWPFAISPASSFKASICGRVCSDAASDT